HPVTIDFVQPLGFLAKTADGHLDARTAQATDAAPADQRVGIAYRYHDASKAGLKNGRDAGGGSLAGVMTRLEGDVQGGAVRPATSRPEGQHLRVWPSRPPVIALPDDPASGHHDRTDHRVGAGPPPAFGGQPDRQRHIPAIKVGLLHRILLEGGLRPRDLRRARGVRPARPAEWRAGCGADLPAAGFVPAPHDPVKAACAAARRAIATRYGEQLT